MSNQTKPPLLETARTLIGTLATIVRARYGNLDDEINQLLSEAEAFLATPSPESVADEAPSATLRPRTPLMDSLAKAIASNPAFSFDEACRRVQAVSDQAFEMGWRKSADWASRADLHADVGSRAYERDRDTAYAERGDDQPAHVAVHVDAVHGVERVAFTVISMDNEAYSGCIVRARSAGLVWRARPVKFGGEEVTVKLKDGKPEDFVSFTIGCHAALTSELRRPNEACQRIVIALGTIGVFKNIELHQEG